MLESSPVVAVCAVSPPRVRRRRRGASFGERERERGGGKAKGILIRFVDVFILYIS